MLYYDVLDEMAEVYIPSGIHPELYVNARLAWVETVIQMIERGAIKGKYDDLVFYAKMWEPLLYKKFSMLN
jgi:hypothetical protein